MAFDTESMRSEIDWLTNQVRRLGPQHSTDLSRVQCYAAWFLPNAVFAVFGSHESYTDSEGYGGTEGETVWVCHIYGQLNFVHSLEGGSLDEDLIQTIATAMEYGFGIKNFIQY